ncbi:MAG: PP2C family protein-serine/threonine phosphatase [Thiolinea sp.]
MAVDKQFRILVVDDIDDNRFTLDLMLSVLGDFAVDEAESGPEALSMMQAKTYDLVLLDIMMPGMTGLQVLEQLDLAHAESATKIIVVSALQDMDTIVRALELGALDYLPKPIEEAFLAARLRQLLERKATDADLKKHRDRIDADLKKAAEIQLSLCPGQPVRFSHSEQDSAQHVQFEFAGTMRPAYEVGGDFYDYFALPNGNHVIVVADACGKGAPAAIYATRVHDLVRLIARNLPAAIMADAKVSLEHMLGEVNRVLSEANEDCWFVTAWVGILEPQHQRISWCSAGHCEALLSSGGELSILHSEIGLPLGLDTTFVPQTGSAHLSPGETVYVYTDGITEHRQPDGQFLGINGLQKLIQANNSELQSAISGIADCVECSNADLEPVDDITLLGLRLS